MREDALSRLNFEVIVINVLMQPFSNVCSCFDGGKQRLLLDLSSNQRVTSQKSYFSQNLDPLTVIVRLLVIILLVIELRRSHLFRFFL